MTSAPDRHHLHVDNPLLPQPDRHRRKHQRMNPQTISTARQKRLASRRQLRMVDAGEQIERDGGELSFSARIWAQLSLPCRNPGDVPRWSRKNGSVTVTLTPGPAGYPYGVVARYLLLWISTEAVRTRDRHLSPGPSLNAFLRALGQNTSGASGRRVTDQLYRLTTCSITIEDTRQTTTGTKVSGANLHVASRYELTFPTADDRDAKAAILLSQEYYDDLIAAPIPVFSQALKALAGSPMRVDLYVWLCYRMAVISKPVTVTWAQLQAQFGADYSQRRQFKAKLLEALDAVRVVYPRARVAVTDAGLRLHPSPTHVSRGRRQKQLGMAS